MQDAFVGDCLDFASCFTRSIRSADEMTFVLSRGGKSYHVIVRGYCYCYCAIVIAIAIVISVVIFVVCQRAQSSNFGVTRNPPDSKGLGFWKL
jgi:hypothetical protein